MSEGKYRLVLAYNAENDDFSRIDSESLAPESSPILIIDENEKKSRLFFPKSISLIQKRTVERRVSSYLKAGYSIDKEGLRIGANFPLEVIGSEILPEILLTHGHSFGKAKLKREDNLSTTEIPQSSLVNQEEISRISKPLALASPNEKNASIPPSTKILHSINDVQSSVKEVSTKQSLEASGKLSEEMEFNNFAKYFELGLNYEQYFDKIENSDHKSKYKSYYERFNLSTDHKSYLENDIENKINILIIGAEWCGDCQVNVPIIQHIVQNSKNLSLRILIKENYSHLVLKTNGGLHIPYVMFLSSDGYIVERWSERSTEQYLLYAGLRKQLGWDSPEFIKESKKLFTHDYEKFSQATANEIIQKIRRADAILSTSPRLHKNEQTIEH